MEGSKSIFEITKGTKAVIIVMTVLVLIGILIAYRYYGKINSGEDPRIIEAKVKYSDYHKFVNENNIEGVFNILDTIEQIYQRHDDYKASYEVGVLQNNRAAAWLTRAISENDNTLKQGYLKKARKFTDKAIDLFTNWLDEYEELSEPDIYRKIHAFYNPEESIYHELDIDDIIDKRIQDIVIAQLETKRRLSVAYTNLGTIYRHSDDYTSAIKHNKKALELWPENLTAKNNINILLGRPIEERSTLDKLFPKSKDSK